MGARSQRLGAHLAPAGRAPTLHSQLCCTASLLGTSVSLILQSHRNLSQLPNFAFSVPLAYFFLSQQEERPELERSQARERAARLIQLALIMFPSGESVPSGEAILGEGFVTVLPGQPGLHSRQAGLHSRQEFAKGLWGGSPESEQNGVACAHVVGRVQLWAPHPSTDTEGLEPVWEKEQSCRRGWSIRSS